LSATGSYSFGAAAQGAKVGNAIATPCGAQFNFRNDISCPKSGYNNERCMSSVRRQHDVKSRLKHFSFFLPKRQEAF